MRNPSRVRGLRGRDILLRGRGADVGTSAPALVLALIGATLGLCMSLLVESLGFATTVGITAPMLRLTLFVLGAMLARTALGGVLWMLTGVLAALFMIVTFTPLVAPFAHRFVRADAPRATQAVIVLSGGMNDEGLLRTQALDRLLSGVALVRERGQGELALSITHDIRKARVVTSEADQRALVDLALPGVTPRFVRDVFSTRDEALAFAALARTHGWRDVTVVTSPLHSARACAALEHEGLRVECRPAAPRDYSLKRLDLAENRRQVFADMVYETAAWVLYRFRGWL